MFHIVEISARGARLHMETGALQLTDPRGNTSVLPLDELDAVILSDPAVGLTGAVLEALAKERIVMVCCDSKYLPVGILYPVIREGVQEREMVVSQVAASVPLKKRLWKKIVACKIREQAHVLMEFRNSSILDSFPSLVQSGDSKNTEGRAAVIYWRELNLFPSRNRSAADANRLLNYIYTILHAAAARYICASGMHPRFGLHHCNQYNAFCLASDLIEPYRPFADRIVIHLLADGGSTELSFVNRKRLIAGLYQAEIVMPSGKRALFDAIRETVSSLKKCFKKNDSRLLQLPQSGDL